MSGFVNGKSGEVLGLIYELGDDGPIVVGITTTDHSRHFVFPLNKCVTRLWGELMRHFHLRQRVWMYLQCRFQPRQPESPADSTGPITTDFA